MKTIEIAGYSVRYGDDLEDYKFVWVGELEEFIKQQLKENLFNCTVDYVTYQQLKQGMK